jgi:hypothetical protein
MLSTDSRFQLIRPACVFARQIASAASNQAAARSRRQHTA